MSYVIFCESPVLLLVYIERACLISCDFFSLHVSFLISDDSDAIFMVVWVISPLEYTKALSQLNLN